MSLDQIIAFAIFAAVAAGTPGPSNVMLTAVGASVGWLRGLRCLFGVAAGMGALIFVSAFGLGGFLLAFPMAVPVMKAAGTLFLIYLAWKIATSTGVPQANNDGAVGFWQAAGFQWINPKAWMAGIGAAASLGAVHENVLRDSAMLGAIFAAVGLVVCVPWLAFGSLIRRVLVDAKPPTNLQHHHGRTLGRFRDNVLDLARRNRLLAAIVVEAAIGLAAEPAGFDIFHEQRTRAILRIRQALIENLHDRQTGIEADEVGQVRAGPSDGARQASSRYRSPRRCRRLHRAYRPPR